MQFIDTHCHLYADQFNDDRNEVIQKAFNEGVNHIILPNIDKESVEGMLSLKEEFPSNISLAWGLHPCSVGADFQEVLSNLKPLFQKHKTVAVGEIGIDLYWDKTFLQQQTEAFKIQCEWAKELGLPIIIHARDSFQEIFEVLDEIHDENLFGVFHCFSGTEVEAQKILSYGNFYLGLGGVLTFKKSGVDKALVNVPLDKLILETDAPYLAPTPNRGKRNEPSYIPLIAEKLSEVKNVSLEEIATITTFNAKKLFKL